MTEAEMIEVMARAIQGYCACLGAADPTHRGIAQAALAAIKAEGFQIVKWEREPNGDVNEYCGDVQLIERLAARIKELEAELAKRLADLAREEDQRGQHDRR